ncbi:MAG: CHAT domain-containing protein [Bacteroidota bacterium]
MEELKKEVYDLIRNSRIDEAFDALLARTPEEIGDVYDEILLQSSQWKDLHRDKRNRRIDHNTFAVRSGQITSALIDMLNELGVSSSAKPAEITAETKATTILFLAANPTDTGQLRLGEEIREIDESLTRSRYRDQFTLVQKHAVRPTDLNRAMLEESPEIVHFSGHGVLKKKAGEAAQPGTRDLFWEGQEDENQALDLSVYSGGLALENDQGKTLIVRAEALAGLFALYTDIRCVFLNACYSAAQADALIQHVPFVVGMSDAVPDITAIKFATGFYDALGAGKDVETAFRIGKSLLALENLPGKELPVLRKKESM